MSSISRSALPIAFAMIGVLRTASGQWPHQIGADLLATSEAITASAPHVAGDGGGGVFAAWNDNRNAASNGEDIFAQYFNANGIAQWPANGVAVCTALNRQDEAVVVSAGGGSVYVIWYDERGAANNERIFAQRLNAEGVAQWAANGIRVGPNDFDQTDLVAVSDGAGNLLVAWVEVSNDFRTFVQKIDNTGALLWGASGFEFSSGVFEGAAVFNVVPDSAGGAVLGWIRFGDNPRTVRSRRILANGTAAFATVSFGTDVPAIGNFISMAPDGAGGAILGWQVDNGVNDDLYIQRVDGTGNLSWGAPSKLLVDAAGVQDNLRLVTDGAGGAYLAWNDPRSAPDNVYLQHVAATGTFSFAANGLPAGTSVVQRSTARLISDGAGGAIVSFRHAQEGTYVQRINNTGTRLWGNDGSQLTDNGTVNFPSLTTDGSNGAILGALAFTNGNRAALKRVLASGLLPTSRLVNISTRAFVGVGEAQAIPGFVISGTGSKELLVRAVGPTLGPFGVSAPLADPLLTMLDAVRVPFLSRDDWGTAGDATTIVDTGGRVGAFPLPGNSKDSAIVINLAPALYTAGVTGVGNTTGVGLVEIYDADPLDAPARIVNLSSRVFVDLGERQAIPGFVISGPATMTLLIRAVGPTLGGFGVGNTLADPILTLYDGNSVAMTTNDDWDDGGSAARNAIVAAATQVNAFALATGTTDSSLLVTLAPGKYTAGAVGANNGTGICLVELYVVP